MSAAPAYEHAGGFVVRSPLLPFATLTRLLASLRVEELGALDSGAGDVDVDRADLAAAIDHDQAVLAERLRALLVDPVVREAIFLSSPSLDERIGEWLRGDDVDERAVIRSTLAYVSRMSTRSTPFGLFAGCSTGTIEDGRATELQLARHTEARRHTRIDFGFLAGVLGTLEQDPAMQATLTFRPNSGLYRAGGRLRVAEARIDRGVVRYRRVAFDEDGALRDVLARARDGATQRELAMALVDEDGEVTLDEAIEYVAELIDAQLLVSDLGPAITGDEPVRGLVQRLAATEPGRATADCLADAQQLLDNLDRGGVGADPAIYQVLTDGLRKLDPDLDPRELVQVDMVKPAPRLALGDDIAQQILRAVDVLHRVGPTSSMQNDLTDFRDRFRERYEDRQVPLLEALDEEVGIGFGGGEAPPRPSLTTADTYRLRLLTTAIAKGASVVRLDDADIAALTTKSSSARPDALAVTCVLAAPGADAAAAGDYKLLLQYAHGPSGARMLGRFCHADPALETLVRDHIEAEERSAPDAVFAEVVHLAEGRLGNVLARPVLRSYEIEFHGCSGADDEHKLPVGDLLVSVEGSRIVLRSQRLGREVRPRLTSAHAFRNAELVPYRFLCLLQEQDIADVGAWSWGELDHAPFLPRVEYGKLVLSRARWNLEARDIEAFTKAKTTADRFLAARELRRRYQLPRWVVVAAADHELTLDLLTAAGCDSLAHQARQLGRLRLLELFPTPGELCMETPDGPVCHELVVPLTRAALQSTDENENVRATAAPMMQARPDAPAVDEVFAPGSEWLSAKLYTGKATADALLRDVVAPLAAHVMGNGLADRWFFIRYGDPDWHLRLRFHGNPDALAGGVLRILEGVTRPLLEDGRLWRLQLDTYRRETERYGGPEAIALGEQLFHADSEAVVAALRALPSDDDSDVRWRVALVGVDRLLADLDLPVDARQRAVRAWRDGLADEQSDGGKAAHKLTGTVMRRERDQLAALLDGAGDDPSLAGAIRAFDARSAALAPVIGALRDLEGRGRLQPSLLTIAWSYNHMHVNRVLRADQRLQELLIYDLLDRLYSSRIHRERSA